MRSTDLRLIGLSNVEKRNVIYKEEADELMLAAQAYEKEGNQVKADEMWALWSTKRAEIRAAYPDE